MFTGIIEQTGIVESLYKKSDIYCLSVCIRKTGQNPELLREGDSVAVNGACLTVVGIKKKCILFDVMEETFNNTAFRQIKKEEPVNLERALKREGRLEGHFVLGHVDGARKISSIGKESNPYLEIELHPADSAYVIEKGSVAIDGISLTIARKKGNKVQMRIIPHTLANTNLKHKKAGGLVNVEFDILGKYILNKTADEKMKVPRITETLLREKGFI